MTGHDDDPDWDEQLGCRECQARRRVSGTRTERGGECVLDGPHQHDVAGHGQCQEGLGNRPGVRTLCAFDTEGGGVVEHAGGKDQGRQSAGTGRIEGEAGHRQQPVRTTGIPPTGRGVAGSDPHGKEVRRQDEWQVEEEKPGISE